MIIKRMFLATTNQHELITVSNEEEAKKIANFFDILKDYISLAPYFSDDNTVHFVFESPREFHLAIFLWKNMAP